MNFKRLADIAMFINGKAFKPEEWKEHGLPIIRIQNLTGTSNVFNYYGGVIEERYIIRKGDLLISWSASLGIYEWDSEDGVLNQHIFKVKLNSNIDKKYFYYAIQTRLLEMESHVHGSTMKHITKGRFDNIKIPLPDLKTQKQIAAILEDADHARQQRKAANALTEQFLQSSFLHLFGDPVSNEKGWEVKVLSDTYLTTKDGTKCGPFGSALKRHEFITSGVPVWVMDNIQDYRFIEQGCLFVSKQKFLDLGGYKVSNGDIIISRAGTVGKMCVVDSIHSESIISTNLIRLSLNSNKILPVFFVSLMKYFGTRVGKLKTGAEGSFTHMNTGVLNNLEIYLPPFPLQQYFASLVADAEILRQKQQQSERELEHLFQALLQQYFGERTATVIAAEQPVSLAAETEMQYGKG